MSSQYQLLVTCGKGFEDILKKEVQELGYTPLKTESNGVHLKGTLEDCMNLNLHLRTASKVLLLVKRFQASHPDQLYQVISKIPWEDHLHTDGYLCVTSHIQNRFILDTRFGNLKVKDAIVDRIYSMRKKRPDSGPKRDRAVVFLHWINADCHLYFDTSGETISKHGYRRIPFKAPLRESLAAAIIKTTRWSKDMPLINPMAGSGTLAIEAAMMAAGIAPGLKRSNFGFMHLKGYQKDQWQSLLHEAQQKVSNEIPYPIVINDSSLEAIRAATKNAEWAGVKHLLKFEHGDFSKTRIPEQPGVIILNPEYGERLGEVEQLRNVYRSIGDFFKTSCAGYWGYIFSGNPELAKQIGLRTTRKVPFYNGKIECRLLEYEMYSGSKKND